MDFSESTKILFNRIQEIEPENVTKIIGYLLLQDHDREIARLASAPDHLLRQVIFKAMTDLQALATSSPPSPWDPPPQPDLQNDAFYPDPRPHRRSFSSSQVVVAPEFLPIKTCHYFNKGFCKHGSSCRYVHHGQSSSSNSPPPPESFFSSVSGGGGFEEVQLGMFSPGSLEKLEAEIIELLRSKRGNPVSIASLPALYFEKYGRYLQAEGYLTESQRHGKAGYSLTKLLARLKNSIRLIDSRPHGQHAVILAEDAIKYAESRAEKSDPGPIVSGSRQIYLTFPADSTFTEDDVSNYFDNFGPVEDVRIPCQQKRMFGFVTFASSDTVKIILAKGNPHFVCGARVLVKPYREKSKLTDRKYFDRFDGPVYYPSHYSDMEAEFHAMSRSYENSRLMRKQMMMEQHQRALEIEARRLSEVQLAAKPVNNHQPFFGFSIDEFKQDPFDFQTPERFTNLFDVFGSPSNDQFKPNIADQESQVLNLPDSPFSASIASGISTVI